VIREVIWLSISCFVSHLLLGINIFMCSEGGLSRCLQPQLEQIECIE
jgi:hypothetical protein